MVKKISRIGLIKALFVFLILADVCFLTVPGLSNIFSIACTYHDKKFCAVIILVMLGVSLLFNPKIKFGNNKTDKLLQGYFFMVCIVFFGSLLTYRTSTTSFMVQYYYYFIPIAIFFLLKRYESNGIFEYVINAIIIIGTMYAIYSIAAYLLYEMAGSIIMNPNLQLYSRRNGHLRLVRAADFIAISTVLSLIKCFSYGVRQKIKYYCGALFGMIALFVVTQTRIYQIAILATIIVLLIKRQRKLIDKLCIVVLIVVCAFLMMTSIQEFVSSFTEYSFSTENRLLAYTYYLSHFFDHFIFGLGLVPSKTHYSVLHGPTEQYFLSDCGYVAFISIYGVLGVVFLVLMGIYIIKNLIRALQGKPTEIVLMVCGISVYFIVSNWSVGLIDPQRCVMSSMLLACLDYYIRKIDAQSI